MSLNRAEVKQKAKQAIKGNVFSYFLIVLIGSIITSVATSIVTSVSFAMFGVNYKTLMYANDYETTATIALVMTFMMILSFIVSLIVIPCAQMSQLYAALNIYDKSNCDVSDVMYGYKHAKRAIIISLKQTLYVTLWSMLFIIPGVIKAYEYSQAMYISMDHPELSSGGCLRQSKELMRGHKFELFVWGLSFIGWEILASLTCGLLYIWLIPYMQSTLAGFYRELVNQKKDSMFVGSMITDTGDFTEA